MLRTIPVLVLALFAKSDSVCVDHTADGYAADLHAKLLLYTLIIVQKKTTKLIYILSPTYLSMHWFLLADTMWQKVTLSSKVFPVVALSHVQHQLARASSRSFHKIVLRESTHIGREN